MADSKNSVLSRCDIQFLIATSAREESGLREVVASLTRWNYQESEATDVLLEFLRLGEIGVMSVADGECRDYDEEQAQTAIAEMYELADWFSPAIYLTKNGISRYEIDDWGITTERAKFLMFSSQTNEKVSRDT